MQRSSRRALDETSAKSSARHHLHLKSGLKRRAGIKQNIGEEGPKCVGLDRLEDLSWDLHNQPAPLKIVAAQSQRKGQELLCRRRLVIAEAPLEEAPAHGSWPVAVRLASHRMAWRLAACPDPGGAAPFGNASTPMTNSSGSVSPVAS